MNQISSYFQKGSFVRNSAIFASGSVAAYLIGFIFTPVITRIYDPADYGLFSIFTTILAIGSSFSTFSYSDALIIPKGGSEFNRLAKLNLLLSFGFSLLFLLFLLGSGDWIDRTLEVEGIKVPLYIIPILVLLNSFQVIAENFNVREKRFSRNAYSKVIAMTSAKSSVVASGMVAGSSVWGLILGEVIIRTANVFSLLGRKTLTFVQQLIRNVSWAEAMKTGRDYKEYPLFIFPTAILVQVSIHLPIFLLGKYYSTDNLGQYSLAVSLLAIPVQVIGFSIGKVFFQKANEIYQDLGIDVLQKQSVKVLYGISAVAGLGYGIIAAFGIYIFEFVAGNNWTTAGTIARLLAPALTLQLIYTVLRPVFLITGKERWQLGANLISSAVFLILLVFGIIQRLNLFDFIGLIAIGIILRNLIPLFYLTGIFRRIIIPLLLSLIILALFFTTIYWLMPLKVI